MKYRKVYPKNLLGRDFVVGDLHGTLERLTQLLMFVNFDFNKDRLFLVGDLVDRGPESYECLLLLYEPWVHSVQANHEQLMYDAMFDGPLGQWWVSNGGAWGFVYLPRIGDMSDKAVTVRDLAKKAHDLPLMITVERQDGKFFHIIHAELNSIKPLSDADLDDEAIFKDIAFAQTSDGDCITWGRYIYASAYGKKLDEHFIAKFNRGAEMHKLGDMFGENLSHIYSGHTIVQAPLRYKGQTNLDTGSYKSIKADNYTPPAWAGLTMTEPLTDRFWHANDAGVTEIIPVILGAD